MKYNIKHTAKRLLELREIYEYSTSEVAERLNISESEYVELESGNVEISLGILCEAAGVYNVDVTELLTGDAPKLKMFSIVRGGEGLEVDRNERYEHQSLAFNFINKKIEPFLVTVSPNSEGEYLNSHPGQEMNYILEGSVKVNISGHEFVLNKGDTLYFDSSNPHGMEALNNEKAKFIAVVIQ